MRTLMEQLRRENIKVSAVKMTLRFYTPRSILRTDLETYEKTISLLKHI